MGDPSNKCLMPVKSETLVCPGCRLMFNDDQQKPYFLTTCGHSICLACYSHLKKNQPIACPDCSRYVSSRCAESLPINYGLMSIALSFSHQCTDEQNQEEILNDLWHTKEKTVGELDDFCKNMAPLRDQLLDTFIESLQRSMVLLSRYFEASELHQNTKKIMNQVLELSGEECTKELEDKLDCINSVLEHLDNFQVDTNSVNTERMPSVKLVVDDGRFGELKIEEEGLHLYSLTESQTSTDVLVKMANLDSLYFSQVCTTVFLDVADKENDMGRIYINIFESNGYAKLFLSMCLGTHGPSFRGTKFGSSLGADPSFLFGGVYEDQEGKQSTDVPFEGVNMKDIPRLPGNPGSVIARINLKGEICTKFLIFLKEVTTPMPTVGTVCRGMHIVYEIVESLCRNRCVVIKNCGVVMNRKEEIIGKEL